MIPTLKSRTFVGSKFRDVATDVLRSMLRKGVPSLFVNMKEFYADAEKRCILDDIINTFYACLKKDESLDSDSSGMWYTCG
jgi:peptide alpha-N-acetyltransferase